MGILFNSTALGIHFCETSLIFNFKTRLGGEICLCDANMHKGYSKNVNAVFINKTNYSVLVLILWKCLFKLMQYSMVYSVSCRSISRRLLFMHFTGMSV